MAKAELPTPEYLRQRLRFEPDTGKLFWTDSPMMDNNWRVLFMNREAFTTKNTLGYMCGTVNHKRLKAHRVIWAIVTGKWPDNQIDHINHDRADNRWNNLRQVTSQQNMRNGSKPATNKSGVVGVTWHKASQKWAAQIGINGRLKYLGTFDTIEEAADARRLANEKYGFHPNHGT